MRQTGVVAAICAALALSGCGSDHQPNRALKHACDVVNDFPGDYIPEHWAAYADRVARTAATLRDPTQQAVVARVAAAAHDNAKTPRRVHGPTGDRYWHDTGVLGHLCDSNGTPMLP